jgi:hypothetical protein
MKGNSGNTKQKKTMKQREGFFLSADATDKPVQLRRKLTTVTGDVAGTGATFSFGISSTGVTSATEWANLSANYEEYRVRAIRCTVVPKSWSNMNSAALIWYPGSLISGSYPAGGGGSTPAGVLAEDGSRVHAQWSVAKHMTTWESNPDAKLWTRVGVAIPALSGYGLQFVGTEPAPLAYNGLTTHDVYVEYDCEFRGRN